MPASGGRAVSEKLNGLAQAARALLMRDPIRKSASLEKFLI
jgi:hypothetical protein